MKKRGLISILSVTLSSALALSLCGTFGTQEKEAPSFAPECGNQLVAGDPLSYLDLDAVLPRQYDNGRFEYDLVYHELKLPIFRGSSPRILFYTASIYGYQSREHWMPFDPNLDAHPGDGVLQFGEWERFQVIETESYSRVALSVGSLPTIRHESNKIGYEEGSDMLACAELVGENPENGSGLACISVRHEGEAEGENRQCFFVERIQGMRQ